MATLSFRIAYPIIIAGFFIIVSYIALNYENLNTSFYIVSAFLVAYVFLFGFAIGQNFTAPVKKLLKKADDLSKGDLTSRSYIESKDEIGQLSNAFNRIADQLEESNYENEKTKKSVGIKVEAETHSLKEIIGALEQKVQNRTLEIQKMVEDLQKFKEYSQAKEKESEELKNEILDLKNRLGHGAKKSKASKSLTAEKQSEELTDDVSVENAGQEELGDAGDIDSKAQALKATISDLEEKMKDRAQEFQKAVGDLDKFKKDSKTQEEEISKLENQLNKLTKKSG